MVKPAKKPNFAHVAVFMAYFKAIRVLLDSKEQWLDIVRVYLFKHCLELISKAIIDPDCKNHSLKSFSNEIMKRYPIMQKWEQLEFDLTDEWMIDFKKRVVREVMSRKDLVEKHSMEELLQIMNWARPPRINAKHLYEILAKYDFWDSNNTYFRYFDSEEHKTWSFKAVLSIVDEIRKDIIFLKKCETFFSYIFMSEYEKTKL